MDRIRSVVDALCSPACAGRRSGTAEGDAARDVVLRALRDAGLDAFEQPALGCGGARFVRAARTRPDGVTFDEQGNDDAGTLEEIADVVGALRGVSPEAEMALEYVTALRAACDPSGRLPPHRRGELASVVGMIESRLA
jgi:hypothetical protein